MNRRDFLKGFSKAATSGAIGGMATYLISDVVLSPMKMGASFDLKKTENLENLQTAIAVTGALMAAGAALAAKTPNETAQLDIK